MAFAGVVLCASVTGVLGLIAAPSEQAGKLAGPLRIKLVGQSLIRADTRSYEPLAVEQAKSYLAGADVVFTNLEVAVAAPGVPVTKENPDDMVYSPDVIDTLKAMGFNLLALGNNHSMEFGKEGLFSTIAEVEKRGIPHAGTGKNSEEAAAPAYLKTPAGTVALVGMATLGAQLTKDKWATADRPGVNYLELRQDGTLNPADKARILRAVKEAVARAQFVIVYHHNHYWGEPLAADTLPGPPKRERKVNRFDTAPWVVAWARQLHLQPDGRIRALRAARLLRRGLRGRVRRRHTEGGQVQAARAVDGRHAGEAPRRALPGARGRSRRHPRATRRHLAPTTRHRDARPGNVGGSGPPIGASGALHTCPIAEEVRRETA
jgi:hypothetical protein